MDRIINLRRFSWHTSRQLKKFSTDNTKTKTTTDVNQPIDNTTTIAAPPDIDVNKRITNLENKVIYLKDKVVDLYKETAKIYLTIAVFQSCIGFIFMFRY
jgi:hypothetical protein